MPSLRNAIASRGVTSRCLNSHSSCPNERNIDHLKMAQPSNCIHVQGYLPGEYECLHSSYGSEADLRRCIKVLHAHGIKALADIVLNHRCAGKQVLSCGMLHLASAVPPIALLRQCMKRL